jgi:hypothetical protein
VLVDREKLIQVIVVLMAIIVNLAPLRSHWVVVVAVDMDGAMVVSLQMALQGVLVAVREKIISHPKWREASHQPKRLPADGRPMEILAEVVHIHPEFKLALEAVELGHLEEVLQHFECLEMVALELLSIFQDLAKLMAAVAVEQLVGIVVRRVQEDLVAVEVGEIA